MRKNPMGGPDRIRVTSHAKSLLSASLALRRLGEPLERARKNDARAGNEIAFSQHDVGGEIVRSPTLEERGNERPELGEEIAQLEPLPAFERGFGHRRTLPRRFSASCEKLSAIRARPRSASSARRAAAACTAGSSRCDGSIRAGLRAQPLAQAAMSGSAP